MITRYLQRQMLRDKHCRVGKIVLALLQSVLACHELVILLRSQDVHTYAVTVQILTYYSSNAVDTYVTGTQEAAYHNAAHVYCLEPVRTTRELTTDGAPTP